MRYTISGTTMQILSLDLAPGETDPEAVGKLRRLHVREGQCSDGNDWRGLSRWRGAGDLKRFARIG